MNKNIWKYSVVFIVGLIIGFGLTKVNLDFTPTVANDGNTKGESNAPVTIVEYSDFQCPLCKRHFNDAYQDIMEEYVETGKVKYQFKHFPLNMHPKATPAAIASECANEQGKFWQMHDQIFNDQSSWSPASADHDEIFKGYATDLQLNINQFNKCYDEEKYADLANQHYQEGLVKGVSGTPTFFINDTKIVGAQGIEQFRNAIEAELEKSN